MIVHYVDYDTRFPFCEKFGQAKIISPTLLPVMSYATTWSHHPYQVKQTKTQRSYALHTYHIAPSIGGAFHTLRQILYIYLRLPSTESAELYVSNPS